MNIRWILDNCLQKTDPRMEGDAYGPDGRLRDPKTLSPSFKPKMPSGYQPPQIIGQRED